MGLQYLIVDRWVCSSLKNLRNSVKASSATKKEQRVILSIIEEAQLYVDRMESALDNDFDPKTVELELKEYKQKKRSIQQDIKELKVDKRELELEIKELKTDKREVTFGKKTKGEAGHTDNINNALESKGKRHG